MNRKEYADRVQAMKARISALGSTDDLASSETLEDLRWRWRSSGLRRRSCGNRTRSCGYATSQLDRERRRYQELFEFAPDAYLVTDLERHRAPGESVGLRAPERPPNVPPRQGTGDVCRQRGPGPLPHSPDRPGRPAQGSHTAAFRLQPREGTGLDAELTYAVAQRWERRVRVIRWLMRDVTERERMAPADPRAQSRSSSPGSQPGPPISPQANRLSHELVGGRSRAPVARPRSARPSPVTCRSWRASGCWPGGSRTTSTTCCMWCWATPISP